MTDLGRDPVAYVDSEWLGLDVDRHPVWEYAVLIPFVRRLVVQVQVTERDIACADPVALEIGRFKERYRAESAVPRAEAARRLYAALRPLGNGDRWHLAGMCVSGDEERLRRLLWEAGLMAPWHYHIVDIEAVAVGYLRGRKSASETIPTGVFGHPPGMFPDPPRLPWSSEDLSRAVGVDPGRFARHTALGDCEWAQALDEACGG